TPVRVAVGAVTMNMALSLMLMQTPLSYGGLALANSAAALLEACTLAWLLSARLRGAGVEQGMGRLSRSIAVFVAAALPMGAASYAALRLLDAALDTSRLATQVVLIATVGLVGVLVYVT